MYEEAKKQQVSGFNVSGLRGCRVFLGYRVEGFGVWGDFSGGCFLVQFGASRVLEL